MAQQKNQPDLKPFIDRVKEYDAQIETLEADLRQARERRSQLLHTIHTMEVEFGVKANLGARAKKVGGTLPTLRERILYALQDAGPEGLETMQLKAAIEKIWDVEVGENSLRTFLSEHKRNGHIIRERKKWKFVTSG